MSTPRGCTNLKLRQLSRLVTRHYEQFFVDTGLHITQYSLLSHIVRMGSATSGEVAAEMRLAPSALTRNLRPLVEQGWVHVSPGLDARQRVLQITPAGLALRESTRATWKRAQLALNRRLGSDRVAALHALLDQGIAALEAAPDAGETIDDD